MPVTRAADAPIFTLPGFRFTGLTAPSRGASEICTWRLAVEPNASGGQPHWLDHEEVFILLEGTLSVTINDEQVSLAAGDALAVPAHARIQVSNPDDHPAHALVCVPAGMRAFTAEGKSEPLPGRSKLSIHQSKSTRLRNNTSWICSTFCPACVFPCYVRR